MQKIKKYNKKIILILIVIIMIFSSMEIFMNKSKAATYLIDSAKLYSKCQITTFRYKGAIIVVEFVVYKKDGVEYPAYCLNKYLPGVDSDTDYTVNVEKEIENDAIWRVITNGYPFKTPAELGCNDKFEAYAATKMAVYDAMYHYDWSDFTEIQNSGGRAIAAAEKISKMAKSSNKTRPVAKIDIEAINDEWEIDKNNPNYVSKTYKTRANLKSNKYNIQLSDSKIDSILVTDINNKEKTEFRNGEDFKILIPINDLQTDGKFEIKVTADMETWPILYGTTGKEGIQDYAVTAGYVSYEDFKFTDSYYKNKTVIEIIKQDTETGDLLKGAKFRILDENKNVIYSGLETNEKGTVQIEDILPGKYFVEEVKAPDGYTMYEELIEVDVKLNQIYTVKVNNNQKPKEKEKEPERAEIKVTSKKEIKLPRTGF